MSKQTGIKGEVFSGRKEGRSYLDAYSNKLEPVIGFSPYPGTLNLKIEKMPSTKDWETIEPFESYGGVYLKKCSIMSVEAYAIIPEVTHHEKTLELIAPFNLRELLNLSDGSEVIVIL